MSSGTGATVEESLAQCLRRALHHLYDPAELRRSPLWTWFGLGPRDSPSKLRVILEESVAVLRPPAGVPAHSDAWRPYLALHQRYVERYSQVEVASALGISIRQLRREETLGLHTLAEHLRARYSLPLDGCDASLQDEAEEETTPLERAPEALPPDATPYDEELAWLGKSSPAVPVDLAELIRSVMKTAAPLLDSCRTGVALWVPDRLPRVAVHESAARQALLYAVTGAARAAAGGEIQVEAGIAGSRPWVRISAQPLSSSNRATLPELPADLDVARALLALSGATLEPIGSEAPGAPAYRLEFSAAETRLVLAVDDNADALELLARYLAGSRYGFVSTRDPDQAVAVAEALKPAAIVLDVMLPQVDGWELLGRLQAHPATREIPVIVSTILPQEAFAMALGATAFLRKPVSQEAFLAILARLAPLEEIGS